MTKINPKVLKDHIVSEEVISKIYDKHTKNEIEQCELIFANARVNPSDEELAKVKGILSESQKSVTNEEVQQCYESVLNLTWVCLALSIQDYNKQNKSKTINISLKQAKSKEKRILSVKPFTDIECPRCSTIMLYKWSMLYEEPIGRSIQSSVLLFYECLNCSKRKAIFEDGRPWISKTTNRCGICRGRRQTTITKDSNGKVFIIYGCIKCGSQQVEMA